MEEVFRAKLNSEGRLNIPVSCRKRLGLQPGQEVLMQIRDEGLLVYTQDQALKRVQDWMESVVPAEVSLAAELIAERNAEAAKVQSEQ